VLLTRVAWTSVGIYPSTILPDITHVHHVECPQIFALVYRLVYDVVVDLHIYIYSPTKQHGVREYIRTTLH
jgi:hypothetical protein